MSRHEIMQDRDFWSRLESEACGWFRNSEEKALRHFWIDGFVPERITDRQRGADVVGTVWVAEGSRQDAYRFLVLMPQTLLQGAKRAFSMEDFVLDREIKMLQMVILTVMQVRRNESTRRI